MVLNRLPGLYGLKYDSATVCRLPLYLCSYKLIGSATLHVQELIVGSRTKERKVLHGIKHSLPLLHEHMYAHKKLNKMYRLLLAPPL